METSTKFSNTELVFLISNCIFSKLFLVYPSAFSALGATASIILALFTSVLGFIFSIAVVWLYKSKADISHLITIRPVRICFLIIIILLFIGNQGYFVRSVAESLKISILPDSPLFFITFIYMAGVVICSHTGLKAIIRAHSFVTPFTMALVVLLLLSSVKNFDYYNIFPIMGNGFKMLPYLGVLTSYFADFLLLLFIIPFGSEKASCKKILFTSFAISSVMLIVIMGMYTLTIPYSASGTFFIPVYRIAQYVNYESFMARMESVFTIGWMLSYFLTSATYLYVTAMLTGRMWNAKSFRPHMYVIALIIFAISFIPQDTNQLIQWSNFIATPRLVAGMIIPLIILIGAKIREGKRL